MEIDPVLYSELVDFRKELHKHPELSGQEKETPIRIKQFVKKLAPNATIAEIGGNGIAFIFEGQEHGFTTVIRADMDALPIQESNEFEHKSVVSGVGHKCGHDGHTAIVAGLADLLIKTPIKKGKIVLLFQPAEEIGLGASRIMNDPKFQDLNTDFVFGLHNLPGYAKGSIIIKDNTFAAASTGLILQLTGKTAHAAEPENGNSPVIAMANIMKDLTYLPQYHTFNNLVVSTVIHSRLGEVAFGTTPGYGEVMATLRAFDTNDFEILKEKSIAIARNHANINNLKLHSEFVEEFPATINNTEGVELIKSIATKFNYSIVEKEEPFKWSEDFGHYSQKYRGAFFGIGSGENHPQLHNPDYDFPDDIIPIGLNIFNSIINKYNR